MTKAEQRALEAYPDVEQKIYHGAFGTITFDRNAEKREGFIKGYQQAEKDLIEKACEFLKSYRQDTYDGTGYIAGIVNDKTIDDFRKYMKGE